MAIKIIFLLFGRLRHNETDGEICAVADPDDDDDNSAANHIEKVGAQRCGEHYPENPQSSQCKFKKKRKKQFGFC